MSGIYDDVVEVARRTMVLFFVVDCHSNDKEFIVIAEGQIERRIYYGDNISSRQGNYSLSS